MRAPHTVGPWEADGEGQTVAVVMPEPGHTAVSITAPATSRFEAIDQATASANRALIVAAPDLLREARAVLVRVSALVGPIEWLAAVDPALAGLARAVAKAEGGSHV